MAKTAEKKPTVKDVLAKIRKTSQIGTAAEIEFKTVQGLTTGNIVLDFLTGVGGFPRGRITEVYGPPSSGKTTSALQAMAAEQKKCIEAKDGYVMYLDFEHALDPEYCKNLGLDIYHETFLLMQPRTFEEGADAFRELLATGELRMATFDSVAAMVTEKEINADTGASTPADRAKMLHQFCRQIRAQLADMDTAAVFINHSMDLLDMSPMGQQMAARGIKRQTQPGGKALPYYASVRIEFKQTGTTTVNELDQITGTEEKHVNANKVEAKVVKNKVGVPFRKAELRVRFGKGFSQEFSIYNVLLSHGIVKKSASWFKFPEQLALTKTVSEEGKAGQSVQTQFQGEEAVLEAMEQNPAWTATLLKVAETCLAKKEDVFMSEAVKDVSEEYDVDPETGEVR